MSKPKTKPLTITMEVPDEKHMMHIANAYGLVCQYRTANKVPHEKMEKWLLRLVFEGCNALYNFHNQQLAEQEKKKQQATSEDKGETGEQSESEAVQSE